MFQLYTQGAGQKPYYQASSMGCCMWKPPTLAVQENSRNIVYPGAIRLRVLKQGSGTSASSIYLVLPRIYDMPTGKFMA